MPQLWCDANTAARHAAPNAHIGYEVLEGCRDTGSHQYGHPVIPAAQPIRALS